MTIVFDAGALIAAERGNSRLATLIDAALKVRTTILIPTVVIAETWRGSKTHPRVAKLIKVATAEPELSSTLARAAGALLATAGVARIVDATVIVLAASHAPATVVTSDPKDLLRFAAATGRTWSLEEQGRPADITIFPL